MSHDFVRGQSVAETCFSHWELHVSGIDTSTQFCETQWRHSVKIRLYKNPPPYFIVLASSVKTKEVGVIEFHRMLC